MATPSTTQKLTHQEQLARLKAEVRVLREQLRQAQGLATMGMMTAMVAHEFNNILTPIINYAQLARSNPALVDKAICRAAEGGRRASTICQAILGLASQGPREAESFVLREAIGETIEAMARDPQRDLIELTVDVPANLRITTRRVELQQVLLNLILNARAAVLARPGLRHIEVLTERKDKRVLVHVRDNGVGIEAANLERIFQPFYTTRKGDGPGGGGHGLGLTICREIVTSLGGQITVASQVGQGTAFTVCLPA